MKEEVGEETERYFDRLAMEPKPTPEPEPQAACVKEIYTSWLKYNMYVITTLWVRVQQRREHRRSETSGKNYNRNNNNQDT